MVLRVNGQTHWLWCFTKGTLTYYQIDRSRGHEGLQHFFHEALLVPGESAPKRTHLIN